MLCHSYSCNFKSYPVSTTIALVETNHRSDLSSNFEDYGAMKRALNLALGDLGSSPSSDIIMSP